MLARRIASWSFALLVLGCGCTADKQPVGGDGAVGADSGSASGDGSAGTDAGGRDASAADMDSGTTTDVDSGTTTDVDSGTTTDVDAGTTTDVDSGTTTGVDAGGSCAGVECTGFPDAFVRGCTNDDSCVGEVHSRDCCSAERIMGMNHSEAAAFCAAETTCRASYPAPSGCTDTPIVTDTGSTALRANVAAHCADIDAVTGIGTCTTFVCGTAGGTPCPTARRIGACATITP